MRPPLLLVLPALAACAGAEARGPAVRDSAGITIVENIQTPAGPYRVVAEEPLFDLGGSGDIHDEFNRVNDAVRFSDGTVAVGDAGDQVIRVFGPDGTWLRNIGRRGGGPGEFQGLSGLYLLPGDTLATYDFQHRRLSLFLPDGTLVRETTLQPGETSFLQPGGRFADGGLAMLIGRSFGPGAESGMVRDTSTLLSYSRDGVPGDTIARFPGPETYVSVFSSGDRRGMTVSSLPFGRSTNVAVGPDRFVVATTDSYELRIHSQTGELHRIVRRAHTLRPVTEEDVEAYINTITSSPTMRPETRDRLVRMNREAPRPETMPAYGTVHLAETGDLWVSEYAVPGENRTPRTWSVFNPEGHGMGDVVLPARFTPFQIGDDRVLGRWLDEDDIHHVRIYRLDPAP